MDLVQSSSIYQVPLSPISFLEQAAVRYGSSVSLVYGQNQFTWTEMRRRCVKLASSLSQLNVSRGDIVVALAPNIPALYELHFAVPMAGGVLSALNTRLDPPTLAVLLQELEPKVIVVDSHNSELLARALGQLRQQPGKAARLVLIQENDLLSNSEALSKMSVDGLRYDELVEMGEVEFEIAYPMDENDVISVSYTSGSTGFPKGVMYSHKAAYLNSLAQIGRVNMQGKPVFLWTVDMFRCNGWCFTWAIAALGGINICLRNASARSIFDAIFTHKVTHLCGAPSLLNMIASASGYNLPHQVDVVIAGALPPRQVLEQVETMGFMVIHAYGMTEALGPVIYKPLTTKAKFLAPTKKLNSMKVAPREITDLVVDVRDANAMEGVPQDGKTIGEVMFKGDTLMTGYYKNPKRTLEAYRGGWFRTGDLGVRNLDGSIVMKDREKDIIVFGKQKISSLEIEAVLISHPMVLEAAVVAGPDETLGERPYAFVKLKVGCVLSGEEMIRFCVEKLPNLMVPESVFFGSLPLNSTGKVQKFVLRKRLESLRGPVQGVSPFPTPDQQV